MERLTLVLTALFIPALMLALGLWYRRHTPKTMRSGYRTRRAMKSPETWAFAHRLLGKYWLTLSGPALIISILTLLVVAEKDDETLGKAVGTLTVLQSLVMLLPCIAIERALKQNFNEDGVPYDPNDLRFK